MVIPVFNCLLTIAQVTRPITSLAEVQSLVQVLAASAVLYPICMMVSAGLILGVKESLKCIDLECPYGHTIVTSDHHNCLVLLGGIAMGKLLKFPLSKALNSVAQVLLFTPMFSCVPQIRHLLALRSIGDWWESR